MPAIETAVSRIDDAIRAALPQVRLVMIKPRGETLARAPLWLMTEEPPTTAGPLAEGVGAGAPRLNDARPRAPACLLYCPNIPGGGAAAGPAPPARRLSPPAGFDRKRPWRRSSAISTAAATARR